MGFGGGGSGSFVLPNHDHTNILADGGELLEATSLIDGVTLQTWVSAEIAAITDTLGWIELANVDLSGGAADTLDSGTFTAKRD